MDGIYEKNISYYERNAHKYEDSSWYFFNKYKDRTLQDELNQCAQVINKNNIAVLEVGPGTGYLLSKLLKIREIHLDYTGIEHSPEMSKILAERYRNKVGSMEVINASVSEAYIAENLADRRYDLIVGSSILHHLPDYDLVVERLSSLLNPNGVMYFVREPIHKHECARPGEWQKTANRIYEYVNALFLKPGVKKLLWPRKVKQEDTRDIAVHMFKDGVSLNPFLDLCKGDCKLLFLRKYNRRATTFFSYLENKWFKQSRMDIFGNTLFAVCIQKIK